MIYGLSIYLSFYLFIHYLSIYYRNEQLSNNDLQVEEVDLAIKMGQRDMDRLKRKEIINLFKA